MVPSSKARHAIKVAIAMVVVYGIALSLDWMKPVWAGYAIVFCALLSEGESLRKGAMRLGGTVIGCVAALVIMALFPQDRWLSMLFLSAWVGFCTYMNGGSKHQYFWFVAGFATVIICFDGGTSAANAFAVTRRLRVTGRVRENSTVLSRSSLGPKGRE